MNVGRALKVACVGIAGGIILRVINMLYSYDYATGFYTDGGFFAWMIMAFIAVISILTIVMCIKDKSPFIAIKERKNVPVGIVTIASGLILVGAGLLQMGEHFAYIEMGYVGRQFPQSGGLHAAFCIMTILYGVLQIATAIMFFTGKNFYSRARLLYLISTAWSAVYLLFVFVNYSRSSSTSENIFTVCSACGIMLTLFYMSKILAGSMGERTVRAFYVVSIPTLILTMTYTVSNIVLSVLDNLYLGFGEIPIMIQIIVLAVAVFILFVLFTFNKHSIRRSDSEPQANKSRAKATQQNSKRIRNV